MNSSWILISLALLLVAVPQILSRPHEDYEEGDVQGGDTQEEEQPEYAVDANDEEQGDQETDEAENTPVRRMPRKKETRRRTTTTMEPTTTTTEAQPPPKEWYHHVGSFLGGLFD